MRYKIHNFYLGTTSLLLCGIWVIPASGQVKTSFTIEDSGTPKAAIKYDLGTETLSLHNEEATGRIEFVTNSTGQLFIDSSGQVGLGTSTPTAPLHLQAGPLRVGASTVPTSPQIGDMIVDSGDSNTLKWYNGTGWQAAGGGSGSPAGATYNIQFNNAGTFAGTNDFIWDDATKSLIIGDPAWPWGLFHMHHASGAYLAITTDDNLTGGYFGVDVDSFYIIQGENKALALGTNDEEKMRIDQWGRVGIGTLTPSTLFHLNHTTEAMVRFQTDANTDGSYIGIDADGLSLTQAENKFIAFSTNNIERMRMAANGNVGIGTDNPSHILHITGQGRSTNSSWATTSDARLKKVIGPYTYGLKEILDFKTWRFHYTQNNPYKLPSNQEFSGVLAQDVKQIIPEAVQEGEDGYLSLNMDPIHWAVVNAVQDLHRENQDLKNQLVNQGKVLNQLKTWVCQQDSSPREFCRP